MGRAGRAVARSACVPSRQTSSNVRTPCRSTTTSAKGAGRSLQCGPWRGSRTHAHALNAGLKRHEHLSAHQPSPASTLEVASPTKQPSGARLTRGLLRRRIQPAVAVACADRRCRAPCPRADGSSRRMGRSGVAGRDGCSLSRLAGRQDQQVNGSGHRPQPSDRGDSSGPRHAAAWRAELVTSRAGRNLGGIPVAQPRAEGASGVRHARSLTVWQECPIQNAVLMRGRQSGRTALHSRQSGMSLRDHPQHFPSAQSFMSHDP